MHEAIKRKFRRYFTKVHQIFSCAISKKIVDCFAVASQDPRKNKFTTFIITGFYH